MDYGTENATRLMWRTAPDLLLNEESLVEVITTLRAQVQALEKNELLSGTALPPWLLKALTDVANNVDTVVECQALQDQVSFLQKEMLELRHEMLLQQSSSHHHNNNTQGYNPTPHHRLSMGGLRTLAGGVKSQGSQQRTLTTQLSGNDVTSDATSGEATGDQTPLMMIVPPMPTTPAPSINVDAMLKPIWDCIHKQTDDFSALRDGFQEAKDTVTRLQAELKRRDAVVQARNSKHEASVQVQVDKLNESLRACVTRNDLIGAEQRIAQMMKIDRQRLMDDVEARSNKLLEELLTSRAEQEDINSMNAETMQVFSRKLTKAEESLHECTSRQNEMTEKHSDMKSQLVETMVKVESTMADTVTLQEKVTKLEATHTLVNQLMDNRQKDADDQVKQRKELEDKLTDKMADQVAVVRGEVSAVSNALQDLVNLNLDSELKAVASKLEMVTLSATDSVRKITALQKQCNAADDQTKTNFNQAFDSIDRMMQNMSTLSEESMRLSYSLQQLTEEAAALTKDFNAYADKNDQGVQSLQKSMQDLHTDLEKSTLTMENEITVVKNQLFHVEDVTSNLKREIEHTQQDAERNLKAQQYENKAIRLAIDTLNKSKDDIIARQDASDAQVVALQAENRAEIQAATAKLVAIVDKESDRVEALYASFQEKQEHFADIVARSSIRNMDLADLNREIDRICESFVSECWKFETSARSSNKTSARDNNQSSNQGGNANSTGRKLFNERQQQLLVKNCQFFADLLVARAEYEVLHSGCNKDVKQQYDLDALMLEAQYSLMEKTKLKIQTKIMNNKNIGEQFDKSTLDRRELYLDTIKNMMDASVKRRTLCSGGGGGPGGGGGGFGYGGNGRGGGAGHHSLFGDSDDPLGLGGGHGASGADGFGGYGGYGGGHGSGIGMGGYGDRGGGGANGGMGGGPGRFDSQRLMTISPAHPTSLINHHAMAGRRKASARDRPGTRAPPGSSELESLGVNALRPAFSPGSSFVLRAGFRLPKSSSPPTSPMTAAARKGSNLSTTSSLSVTQTIGDGDEEEEESDLVTTPQDDGAQGWSTDDTKADEGNSMNKSYSLPALRPQ